jgi:hypothetical protein
MALDRDALLVALVLAPATYSRNRFFHLYTDPEMYRVRRRASVLRDIVRHIARSKPGEQGELLRVEPIGDGRAELTYAVPALNLRRTARLDPLELSLVRFSLKHCPNRPAALVSDEADRSRVEAALRRLGPSFATDGDEAGERASESS